MPRYEIVGTEQKMNNGKGITSPSADPRSGMWQMVGDTVSMGRKSIHSPSANPPEGTYQITGDEARMSRTAVKGWGNAAPMTMSPTATAQSDNVGQKKKGRR